MKHRFGLMMGMAGICGAAWGQDLVAAAQPLDPETLLEPLPVVLSVSRLIQPVEDAPGSVMVIDAGMIRRSGARDLGDLLRMVPGFLAAHAINGAPNAVYHGMTDENSRGLQILIDGRSQYSPLFFGGVAWNLIDVPLADIERIEVVRGSNSAAYGSNAFLGVVNVVTREAADTQGVRVNAAQGNEGVADRYARVGMRVGAGALRLSAETVGDDGVRHVEDRRRHRRVNLRLDLPLGAADEFQLQAGSTALHLRAGEAGVSTNPPRGQEAAKDFVSVAWQRLWTDGGGLALRYTRSTERYRDDYAVSDEDLDALAAMLGLPTPFVVPIDQAIDTTRDELEFQHTLVPGPATRIVWGAGARYDAVSGEQFYGRGGDKVHQAVHRLFGNFEWKPSTAWTANLGLTWENDSLSDTSLAPRFALNHHFLPGQTLRVGVSRAHRMPSLTEARSREHYGALDSALGGLPFGVIPLQIERDASGRLDKERIDVVELGYLGDFRRHGVFVDVRAFRERVRDRIVSVSLPLLPPDCEVLGLSRLRRSPPTCGSYRDYQNLQALEIDGVEYHLRWRPLAGSEFVLNQAFVSIDSRASSRFRAIDSREAEKAERHMENSAPRVSTMLGWNQELPGGLELSLAHYRYDRFQWTLNTAVDEFQRTDIRLAYPFRRGGVRGELALVVQGIDGERAEFRTGDADDDDPTPPYELGPRGWLALTLDF